MTHVSLIFITFCLFGCVGCFGKLPSIHNQAHFIPVRENKTLKKGSIVFFDENEEVTHEAALEKKQQSTTMKKHIRQLPDGSFAVSWYQHERKFPVYLHEGTPIRIPTSAIAIIKGGLKAPPVGAPIEVPFP